MTNPNLRPKKGKKNQRFKLVSIGGTPTNGDPATPLASAGSSTGIASKLSTEKKLEKIAEEDQHSMHSGHEHQSIYSGNSGMGSLVSHSINYFEIGKNLVNF